MRARVCQLAAGTVCLAGSVGPSTWFAMPWPPNAQLRPGCTLFTSHPGQRVGPHSPPGPPARPPPARPAPPPPQPSSQQPYRGGERHAGVLRVAVRRRHCGAQLHEHAAGKVVAAGRAVGEAAGDSEHPRVADEDAGAVGRAGAQVGLRDEGHHVGVHLPVARHCGRGAAAAAAAAAVSATALHAAAFVPGKLRARAGSAKTAAWPGDSQKPFMILVVMPPTGLQHQAAAIRARGPSRPPNHPGCAEMPGNTLHWPTRAPAHPLGGSSSALQKRWPGQWAKCRLPRYRASRPAEHGDASLEAAQRQRGPGNARSGPICHLNLTRRRHEPDHQAPQQQPRNRRHESPIGLLPRRRSAERLVSPGCGRWAIWVARRWGGSLRLAAVSGRKQASGSAETSARYLCRELVWAEEGWACSARLGGNSLFCAVCAAPGQRQDRAAPRLPGKYRCTKKETRKSKISTCGFLAGIPSSAAALRHLGWSGPSEALPPCSSKIGVYGFYRSGVRGRLTPAVKVQAAREWRRRRLARKGSATMLLKVGPSCRVTGGQ